MIAAVGTPSTDLVIAEAARVTRELGGTLHLVAAYHPASPSERERARRRLPAGLSLDYDDDRLVEARDALEDARETVAADLSVQVHLERGELLPGLCRVARREDALLIVAATPAGPLSRRAGARLVNLAPCDVRMIDAAAGEAPRRRLGRPDAPRPALAPAGQRSRRPARRSRRSTALPSDVRRRPPRTA